MQTNRPQHVDQNWLPEDHQPADPVRDAAPELLAALRAVTDKLSGCYIEASAVDGDPALIKARAAIAKAEGK